VRGAGEEEARNNEAREDERREGSMLSTSRGSIVDQS
jgi:hypothetical protein